MILLLFICVLLPILKKKEKKTTFVSIRHKYYIYTKIREKSACVWKGWTQDKFLHLSV